MWQHRAPSGPSTCWSMDHQQFMLPLHHDGPIGFAKSCAVCRQTCTQCALHACPQSQAACATHESPGMWECLNYNDSAAESELQMQRGRHIFTLVTAIEGDTALALHYHAPSRLLPPSQAMSRGGQHLCCAAPCAISSSPKASVCMTYSGMPVEREPLHIRPCISSSYPTPRFLSAKWSASRPLAKQ